MVDKKKPRPVKGGALNRVGGTLLAGFAFAAVAHRFDAAGGFLRGGERFLLQRDFNVTLPDAGGVSVLPRVLRDRRTLLGRLESRASCVTLPFFQTTRGTPVCWARIRAETAAWRRESAAATANGSAKETVFMRMS